MRERGLHESMLNLFVSFMYVIVCLNNKLLISRGSVWWPYKYKFTLLLKWARWCAIKICTTFAASFVRCLKNFGQLKRKWVVSSMPVWHSHIGDGVSVKLWQLLWYFSGLNSRRSWKILLIPNGSWIPKRALGGGRTRGIILFLKAIRDLHDLKSLMTQFHFLVESGKKLLRNLVVLQTIWQGFAY